MNFLGISVEFLGKASSWDGGGNLDVCRQWQEGGFSWGLAGLKTFFFSFVGASSPPSCFGGPVCRAE